MSISTCVFHWWFISFNIMILSLQIWHFFPTFAGWLTCDIKNCGCLRDVAGLISVMGFWPQSSDACSAHGPLAGSATRSAAIGQLNNSDRRRGPLSQGCFMFANDSVRACLCVYVFVCVNFPWPWVRPAPSQGNDPAINPLAPFAFQFPPHPGAQ